MMPFSTRTGSSTMPAGVKTWPPVISRRSRVAMVSILNLVCGRCIERVRVDRRSEVGRDPHGLGRGRTDVDGPVGYRREVFDAVAGSEDERLGGDGDFDVAGEHVEQLLRVVVG